MANPLRREGAGVGPFNFTEAMKAGHMLAAATVRFAQNDIVETTEGLPEVGATLRDVCGLGDERVGACVISPWGAARVRGRMRGRPSARLPVSVPHLCSVPACQSVVYSRVR